MAGKTHFFIVPTEDGELYREWQAVPLLNHRKMEQLRHTDFLRAFVLCRLF